MTDRDETAEPGVEPAPEAQVPEAEATAAAPPATRPSSVAARRAAVTGLRLATGLVGLAASIAAIAAVGLVGIPDAGPPAPAAQVRPVATELSRLCPGSLLRLGDSAGADASSAASVGRATVSVTATGADPERSTLTPSATDAQVITAAPDGGATLAGAQTQTVATDELLGLAATDCREPAGTAWLVGGASTTGRTTLITLSNPTGVAATVELRIWGEQGAVDAPGLAGIVVAAGSQRVVALSGFAQNLGSPVVQVVSRGGRVVATLQESIIRTLDPGGVELTGASATPARTLTIPGVRIIDAQNVGALLGIADYADARTVLRLLSPSADTSARVVLRPVGGGDARTSEVPLTAGTVLDLPLDDLTAGAWTVEVDADSTIVGAVRASTARPLTGAALEAPVSDLAWFPSAEPLDGRAAFTVPAGRTPVLTLANPSRTAVAARLLPERGAARSIAVPASSSVQLTLAAGGYRLTGAAGLSVGLSLGGGGQLAAWTVLSPNPVSGPIVIRR